MLSLYKVIFAVTLWIFAQPADSSQIDVIAWQNSIIQSAQKNQIRNITISKEGIFGKHRSSVVFFGHIEKVPTQARLYWVMVKALSEKYGCFMVRKLTARSQTSFTCKDGRMVVFKYGRTEKMYHFFATQFDRNGRLLMVEDGEVISRVH